MDDSARRLRVVVPAIRLSSAVALAVACGIIASVGCVGPMGCGPSGLGPLALNDCDGCGQCDGCGPLYIDPWINHPPRCPDPCDVCGNYNGQSCGKCRSVFDGVSSLWGYRCGDEGGCDAGCDSGCDSGSCGGGCGPLLPLGNMNAACGEPTCGALEVGCCGSCDSGVGCDSAGCGCCSGSLAGGVVSTPGEITVVESGEAHSDDNVAEVYRPTRERRIFTPR